MTLHVFYMEAQVLSSFTNLGMKNIKVNLNYYNFDSIRHEYSQIVQNIKVVCRASRRPQSQVF